MLSVYLCVFVVMLLLFVFVLFCDCMWSVFVGLFFSRLGVIVFVARLGLLLLMGECSFLFLFFLCVL